MPLLPNEYLDSVIAIGQPNSNGTVRWIGSGLMLGEPNGYRNQHGDQTYNCWIVTARHTIQKSHQSNWVVVGVNPTGSDTCVNFAAPTKFQGVSAWHCYEEDDTSNGKIDIAVCPIRWEELEALKIPFRGIVSDRDQTAAASLFEGESIYLVGYPLGVTSGFGTSNMCKHYPIVRAGTISRIRDLQDGVSRTFLIDALNYPGTSGGPVFKVKPEDAANRIAFLGIASSYLPFENLALAATSKLPIQLEDGQKVMVRENTGLPFVPNSPATAGKVQPRAFADQGR